MGILEIGVVSEGNNIIKNQQVSNGTTNPAKWVSCARYMGQLSHMLPLCAHASISRPASKSCSAVYFIIVKSKCIHCTQQKRKFKVHHMTCMY